MTLIAHPHKFPVSLVKAEIIYIIYICYSKYTFTKQWILNTSQWHHKKKILLCTSTLVHYSFSTNKSLFSSIRHSLHHNLIQLYPIEDETHCESEWHLKYCGSPHYLVVVDCGSSQSRDVHEAQAQPRL